MKASWIIYSHHLALQDGKNVFHPSASDIYNLLSKDDSKNEFNINCGNPQLDLPDIRFSKIGSSIHIKLTNNNCGEIICNIEAQRKDTFVPVDIIEGTIIDQCVYNNTWFYLTGNNLQVQDLLDSAGIKENGRISIRQYLNLIEKELLNGTTLLDNQVDISCLQKPIDNNEEPPTSLKATLFPYQKVGFLWIKRMLEESNGCILGDEMGLGKTMQVITEMLNLKERKEIPMLVVAPISLLTNWHRECAKFAPSLKTIVHYGHDRISNYKDFQNYDVVITSYTTVVSDIHMLNMIKWKFVALDEAQNIKNPFSARARACKGISRKRSIAVSGTPFENHITDIWSLIDFIQPGLLGSLENYKETITDDVSGGKRIEPILSPLMIRRLVVDVAKDLPEKVVSTQALQMSEFECNEYNKYLSILKSSFDSDKINLGMLQQLRIYCTHPYTLSGMNDFDDPTEVSIKYQRFCEIAEEIISREEKIIVFTSYKKMFEIFKKDIPNRFGIQLWTINGETPVAERQQIVDRFNNLSGAAMLILNPKAAGTGLNITGANHVIHYNLEWNPALEDQSSARAYRRGQTKTVFIYRLYYTNTVEQVVNERIERKRDIASSAVVGNDGQSQDRADILRALELIPSIRK
ncbi:DEAD/DEAH box helicase [Prevotella brevis]|uniref:DEAD/DEAH box helicase n=1 Tax=Xylanibacter brevis TaxID=83231 RepID=A0ABS9CIE1_9BACT|nr:DEAD/DEAH box helicase [Xylanibacter brevis]MCF2564781.1 DEAD/DEAH box helicase [Xylanibacter brevis]